MEVFPGVQWSRSSEDSEIMVKGDQAAAEVATDFGIIPMVLIFQACGIQELWDQRFQKKGLRG